jgi:P pilus assembly chaperone PapD
MRRVKFRIDCQPENWPSKIMISPITVALGDNQERMIKIIWIPPGAEDWYESNQTFVPEAQVLEACYWLEVRNAD